MACAFVKRKKGRPSGPASRPSFRSGAGGSRGQLSLEFLVILAVLIVYLGFVLGVWKYSFDRLDLAAQRIAVNKVADELGFYSRFLSGGSKGESEISVAMFPTTRMAVANDKESGIITIRSCSSQNGELVYEREIMAKKASVAESLEGSSCGNYPISGKVRLSVKKTIEGGLEIAGKK